MSLKDHASRLIDRLPYVRRLVRENEELKQGALYPAGHFYSPIVSAGQIRKWEGEIWKKKDVDGIEGIDLRTEEQRTLARELSAYYSDLPFPAEKQPDRRYYFANDYYSYTDGIVLHTMIRHFRPKRIIEIGSGFSSAVMLDTNELFFDNAIQFTFIEPYPERLLSLMSPKDHENTTLVQSEVQSVSLDIYQQLQAGDFLFVDSSHVVKTGSDVNHILFDILPLLSRGVLIHFHDIFYPFEYPKDWVLGGRNWNENYFLKAFLMYNDTFRIRLFSDYLHKHHRLAFQDMPLAYKNSGGNIWLEKM